MTNLTPKIFCIGLSRTGTTTLTQALRILGFTALHYPLGCFEIQRDQLLPIPERFASADAFTDTPIALTYQKLDRLFPGSKFIHTIRPIESWLSSCEKIIGRPITKEQPLWWRDEQNGLWENDGPKKMILIREQLFGSPLFDKEKYRQAHSRHASEIAEYFTGRSQDILNISISQGDGWELICKFLNLPIPSEPFPHLNSSI
ncbi:MAG: hypothetical protein COW24_03975 [Candidatus Kerfeldbacteria bacterium CG15_BIG_FIL_POST_REV_8_21_14_020_45_12]|uniref:Sulfotransferase family protein n=1 Tax=Candidatus Kerfeldbacteria bacterium CG15_BIG_FIL_POST_REV_8_21_14_020_45_12 TaxID=2014247 RepID=A0A2M7H389_9BACT|nr:MAG: hypothetical protein COW24_03975 [Candidatus Kerfeldbacteria bacterium CG15_BIG_FIL_POST_REV_8_21_14_020_45_12]PJA93844.1 MAG: hypothetical protein CO132_01120 [Candidatus Kerfeldbacteria bacterium CG_4_9_14_3_um_filter_45_8]